jgi:hypothetical protein
MIRIAVGRQRRTRFGTPEAWHGSDRRRRPSFETPEACMVRNAGGVACNSLGCKPQVARPPGNRTPEGWHEPQRAPSCESPVSPLQGSKHFFACRPGVCTPGYYVPPLQGSIPRIAIPPRFTRQSHLRKRIVRQTRLHATEEASGTHP